VAELFASGRIVDLILALVVFEAILFALLNRRAIDRDRRIDLWLGLLPGACLLLALRSAQTGAAWTWTAFWLGCAFATHLADVARRWRGRTRGATVPRNLVNLR
jgi:hypothetical protein